MESLLVAIAMNPDAAAFVGFVFLITLFLVCITIVRVIEEWRK